MIGNELMHKILYLEYQYQEENTTTHQSQARHELWEFLWPTKWIQVDHFASDYLGNGCYYCEATFLPNLV